MNSGVYILRNLQNGKVYIGSAININRRKQEHFKTLRRGIHSNIHLQRAWEKYGECSFEWKVLIHCGIDDLLHYEQRAMEIYKEANRKLYNISPTAGSTLGIKHSRESRINMSKGQRGRKHSLETRAKLSLAGRGKKKSSEHILKMSAANKGHRPSQTTIDASVAVRKGKKLSPEHKAKLSKALKGKNFTPEHRYNLAMAQIGRKCSLETRAKISAAHKRKRHLQIEEKTCAT